MEFYLEVLYLKAPYLKVLYLEVRDVVPRVALELP